MGVATCAITDCDRPKRARGWCNAHYLRWWKYGDVAINKAEITLAERLASKLRPAENGCLEWTGTTLKGYGQIGHDYKLLYAHRVAYELAHGSIPDGMHVCHRCDNPPCCNPDHLFLGTVTDNMQDMIGKGRAWFQGERRDEILARTLGIGQRRSGDPMPRAGSDRSWS